MVCGSSCVLAGALLGGFGLTSLLSMQANRRGSTLMASLSDEQRVIYGEIREERKSLSRQGMMIGLLLALGYLIFARLQRGAEAVGWVPLICNAIAITLATTYFYYILMPKSDRMVRYLNPTQLEAHLQKGRAYQLRWTGGLLLGGAAAYFLGQALRK